MSLSLVPIRDDKRLMDDAIPIDGREIFIRSLLECYSHACRNDKMPGYRRSMLNFTNIPRDMKFVYHNKNDEYSLDVSGLRDQTKINDNQTVASFYQDGGKAENKVAPYAPIKLVEGSVIEFRPPPQFRSERFSRNLKFMVVADADADDGVGEEEEEEEAEVVVVDEVVPTLDVVDTDDGVKEVEEAEQSMLIQERHNLAEKSGQVVSLLDTPDKTTVVVDKENTEVEIVPSDVPAVVVKEENLPAVVAEEKEKEDTVLVVEEEAARSFSSGGTLRASSSSSSSNSNNSPAPVMASSMSYLAPFVASVLRDPVLADLLAESKRKDERIQQQEDDRLRLEVTGRNGKPKYYKASMRDGQMTPTGSGFYVFFNRPLLPNFVDKIPRLEVRLGGVNVAPFHQMIAVTMPVERAGFDRTRGNAPQLGRIQFFSNRNDGVQVFGSMGPILPSDYANLPATMAIADLVRFVKQYQAIDGPYISAYMMCYLKILSIFVPTCQINGINFLDTLDKGTTKKNVWGEEKTIAVVDEAVPLVVVEEEHAVPSDEEDGEEEEEEEEEDDGVELVEKDVVVSAVVDEVVPAVVVDEEENTAVPSFEEIRRGMGFSPINNNPTDSVPHDEDLGRVFTSIGPHQHLLHRHHRQNYSVCYLLEKTRLSECALDYHHYKTCSVYPFPSDLS